MPQHAPAHNISDCNEELSRQLEESNQDAEELNSRIRELESQLEDLKAKSNHTILEQEKIIQDLMKSRQKQPVHVLNSQNGDEEKHINKETPDVSPVKIKAPITSFFKQIKETMSISDLSQDSLDNTGSGKQGIEENDKGRFLGSVSNFLAKNFAMPEVCYFL